MKPTVRRQHAAIMVSLVTFAVIACNLQYSPGTQSGAAPTTASGSQSTAATAATPTTPSETAEPSLPSATTAPPATVTPSAPIAVQVSAVGGQLNVRRGPGPEYDPVGALKDGQSTTATARNADSSWVYIQVPGGAKALGWVTIKTQYTTLQGDAASLPVMSVEPAAPAYIRNCTAHEMLVDPGGQVLPDRGNAPDNELQLYPGEYTVTDQVTESEVASPSMFEGKVVEIKKDGNGKSYTCP